MFSVGEYVIYGYEGVCRVEQIGFPHVSGLDKAKQYYTLAPHNHKGTIYAPVDGHIVMRPLISRSELDALLAQRKSLPLLDGVPENGRLAGEYYRAILAEHDCTMLIRLCKTLQVRQQRRAKVRKALSATEMRHWKTAEEMLRAEFCFVLGLPPHELEAYININCA